MNDRDIQIAAMMARGMNVSQVADELGLSVSSIEKRLLAMKRERGCKTVVQLIYRLSKGGIIVICGLGLLQTGELRRNVRLRRREQYAEFLQSYHKPGDRDNRSDATRPPQNLLTVSS